MYEEIREREEARRRSFAEGAEVSQRRSRILLRDSYDHQSVGRWNIKRVGGDWVHMYLDDWFNTIVHLPILRLLFLMVIIYVACDVQRNSSCLPKFDRFVCEFQKHP